jgi:NAD(P)-dependent dehydrogenase (short-subunit alcohol dehydrogenase family)
LTGKVVAITGTSVNFLGFYLGEIAIRKNVKMLLLLNRDSESSRTGTEELTKIAHQFDNGRSQTEIQTVTCDLMDFSSVQKASDEVACIASQHDRLDVLICNAGIMAKSDQRTDDGFDIQMQTNQPSHFLLVQRVFGMLQLPAEKQGGARLVMQSSSARWFPKKDLEQKCFQKSKPGTLGGDSVFKDLVMGWGGPLT